MADRCVGNSYMLPSYRLSAICGKAKRLREMSSGDQTRDAYESLVKKLETADLAEEKGELVLQLLEVREDADALLENMDLSGGERSALKIIRRLDNRFIREIRLKNYEDIYAIPEK